MDIAVADALLDLSNNKEAKSDTQSEGYVTDETRSAKQKQCGSCKGWSVASQQGPRRVGSWICEGCSSQGTATRSKNSQHTAVVTSPKRSADDLGNLKPKRLCKQPSVDRISAATAILDISDTSTGDLQATGEPLMALLRSKRVIAKRVSRCEGSSSHDARSAKVATTVTGTTSAGSDEAVMDAYGTPRPMEGSKWVAPMQVDNNDAASSSQAVLGVPTSTTQADSQTLDRIVPARPVPVYISTEQPSCSIGSKEVKKPSRANEGTLKVLATYFKIQRNPDLQARKMLAERASISLQKVDEWFWFRNKLELVAQAKLQRGLQQWNILQAAGSSQ